MTNSSHAQLVAEGASSRYISEIRRIDYECTASGVLPVYTLRHLSALSGVSYGGLRKIILNTDAEYRNFRLAKKSGRGYRTIRVPSPRLRHLQRFILERCLPRRPSSDIAYAYTPGRGIKDAASAHRGARSVVMLDLQDFFGSVDSVSVYRLFASLGYPELLALEMSLLCTYGGRIDLSKAESGRPYVISGRRFLPQGAPTSGCLSNLALKKVDADLQELGRVGLVVTRYADDIVVSSSEALSRKDCGRVVSRVSSIVRRRSLRVNESKTKVLLDKSSYRILGLAVTAEGVGLTRSYKQRLEAETYGISKFGLSSHHQFRGYDDQLDYIAHLWGHVSFAKGIDKAWGSSYGERLEELGVPYIAVHDSLSY